ncbi:Piwi domain-containing protein [Deminuibacter soli]|uniref:Protein argonaute n=1 Tax=Deminuibacter soli TaxID=2291815 RepID=A0A3E1NNW5_9BACT|nr:Piwi domain-containing protein [Deminuibacter soli]RFM29587.1 hypothetical protein DXN05_00965 [Deminuibacter soli]
MANQTLYFNIIPFDLPAEEKTFYFSLEETKKSNRLHRTLFPNDIETIFPGILSDNTEFIYTTFDYAKEGFTALSIDFKTENQDLLRKYYNRQIRYYFRKEKEQLVRTGFIGQNQVWVKATKLSTKQITVYHKFSLKIQFQEVSNHPELLLSYNGKSRLYNTSVAELIRTVAPANFKKVIKHNELYFYEELTQHEHPEYRKTYPVLNFDLGKALNLPVPEIIKENKYKTYKEVLDIFYDYFLNKEEFKQYIPLHESGFLQVADHLIDHVNDASNELAFSKPNKGRTPKKEFPYKRAFLPCPHNNVHLFFIYHEDDQPVKDMLKTYLDKGLGHYKGLTQYAGILFHPDTAMNICFKERNNPLPEIQNFFNKTAFNNPAIKYLAIYVTPFTREETRRQEVRIYVRVKEMLLRRNIACQFVEPETVQAPNDGFKWSLTNMSVAILAKLGGVPWQLVTTAKESLVIGIGAFRHPDGVQYLSSAFCFDNTGHFNEFAYFLRHETDVMAGSIAVKVKEFAAKYGNPERLVIHFYKEKMTNEEIAPVEAALAQLQLQNPIPVFVVHVNKTEAKDIIAYDAAWAGKWMPYSGTFINIGKNKYLLFNNSRYPNETFSINDGYPFPIKLSINCNMEKHLENAQTIREIIEQVYQFSRMYFKSLAQQNLPVTVKYPEIIAEIAPYMEHADLPDNSINSLWFL